MFNQTIIIGYLGADPETRYTQSGKAVTNFRVATSERWTTKDGEKQEHTEWFNVTAWDKLAEITAEYLHKGSPVAVVGTNRTRKWQDKDGNDRYTTDVIAQTVRFLPSKQDAEEDAPPPARNSRRAAPKSTKAPAETEEFDDDIPW